MLHRPLCMILLSFGVALPALAQAPDPPTSRPAVSPGGPGNFGGFGRRGRWWGSDPIEEIKKQIRATDEEWKVIGPKIRQVAMLRQVLEPDSTSISASFTPATPGNAPAPPPPDGPTTRPAFGGPPPGTQPAGGSFNGPGGVRPFSAIRRGDMPPPPGGLRGPGGRGPFAPAHPLSQARYDLLGAMADTKSTPEQIKARVASLRKAREDARRELQAAQKDLLELLTADQEAVLVAIGYLE